MCQEVIASHHGGLRNFGLSTDVDNGTTYAMLNKNKLYDSIFVDKMSNLLKPESCTVKVYTKFSLYFLTKMLYSCLVDADFLDTERYMNYFDRTISYDWESFKNNLNEYEKAFATDTDINKYRKDILEAAKLKAINPRGFFSFLGPTGSGKTFSGISFAINHLIHNDMDRIIYVAPYNTILGQNGDVFKSIFGSQNVLEHHSSYDVFEDDSIDSNTQEKLKKASENYDFPLVLTSNVQFLETLFSHKTSKNRKLHNITNSVIIVDEAHMLSYDSIIPIMFALTELIINYNCTVLLASATPSNYDDLFELNKILSAIKKETKLEITEIVDNPGELFNIFKRSNIINLGKKTKESLCEKIMETPHSLTILNSRRLAKTIYDMLPSENKYHLSTLMCRAHINDILSEILAKNCQCTLVSTSIVEVGMNIDFPIVYKQIRDLPSIIQSNGRCNRDGRLDKDECFTKIFDLTDEKINKFDKKYVVITESLLTKYKELYDLDAISNYFRDLYITDSSELRDKYDIINNINSTNKCECNYREIGEIFRVIDNKTYSIIIPYDSESENIISKLPFIGHLLSIKRKLQKYTINIYENELKKLVESGFIDTVIVDENNTYLILNNMSQYDMNTGLNLEITTNESFFC